MKGVVMGSKYEIIEINGSEIAVDISMLTKTGEMFFNATDMAKMFDKTPKDFLKINPTKEYMEVIFKEDLNPIKNYDDLVKIKRGKYGGTWLHNELAFEFAGWCSAIFRRNLHKWAEERLKKEADWKRQRLEAKTGYLPMTDAVMRAHENPKFYHYTNEADMINLIVLGMKAKEYKEMYEVDNVRDGVSVAELKQIEHLQRINTGLIEVGMDYYQRKELLQKAHEKQLVLYECGIAA
jgi:hypothetical protein